MDAMVAKIKTMQKTDENAKQQWWAYCDSQGGGVRDPAKHQLTFLKKFVTNYEKGVAIELSAYQSGDRSHEAMIEEIKRLQKGDREAREQWRAYCEAEGAGVRDPSKHDESFIGTFLSNWDAGMRIEAGTQSLPQVDPNASHEEMVQQIKSLQRSDENAKEKWWAFCDAQGGGVRDPAKHDATTLQSFLFGIQSGESFEGVRSPMADLFKEGQRRSEAFKQAWGLYCDIHGKGHRDPAKHDAKSLTTFLDLVAKGAPFVMNTGGFGAGMGGVKRAASPAAMMGMTAAKKMRPGTAINGGGGNMQAMIARIKDYQRSGGQEQWAEYCGMANNGIRDPSKHTAQSLSSFIKSYGVP